MRRRIFCSVVELTCFQRHTDAGELAFRCMSSTVNESSPSAARRWRIAPRYLAPGEVVASHVTACRASCLASSLETPHASSQGCTTPTRQHHHPSIILRYETPQEKHPRLLLSRTDKFHKCCCFAIDPAPEKYMLPAV